MMTRIFPAPAAILRHAALLVTAALILAPFVWMVSLSIKPPGEIFRASFSLWPEQFYGIENYTNAITQAPLLRYMLNGVIVCASILALQIAVCSPAAYALAKIEFAGRDLLFAVILIALLLPHEVLALPLFILGAKIGILNTYAALIFPYVVSPFGIFLFRQFFKTIPDDVVHAARLDGYSEIEIVWKIMIPMALPAIIAFGIFSVVSHWNSLFWPLIAVQSHDLMPPPLGILMFKNEEAGNDYGPLMAAATVVVAPLVIAFLLAQRWFVEGLSSGAIK
ncbi:carbohydrate ABC transporter permease [Sinorhizobium meliloti]|uniref:carbohydrate ABC transporter permease n=1 Tax=Rhizobium meliloti TaxID=382 RepID=UPI0004249208|nr:carbohydrate ABC transporter permease [Sinorhizobium meliloti]MDE3823628.1 carbohydrate ABC transporter permease [Sinorhizobium meliloti]RVI02050.1 carbohydrate ABC transporter permease [Sinorhizobium meliloti]RVM43215.1 carbohydrate ABC transporter permease [Sinorhizobium meliloti]RVN63062.1 carbohydrate ABC transporter permease [Sinorhizobium meliloti]UFX12885.1 carbohydrate ABC transporter permease [Sinorhizobium meliloti]